MSATSADLLRRAAKAMREKAEAATPGPWYTVGLPWNESTPYLISGHPDPHYGKFLADMDEPFGEPTDHDEAADAEHMAAWYPAVALAVADLLRVVDEAPSVPQHAVIVSALDCREVLARIRIAVDVIARVYLREVES